MPIHQMATFRQGPKLKAQYEFNKDMHGGICFSLMVQWFKLLAGDSSVASETFGAMFGNPAQDRMDALDKDFKLAGGRQMIYSSALPTAVISKANYVQHGRDYARLLTEMGRQYGVSFAFLGHGTTSGQVANFTQNPANANKALYLSIKFAGGGGHAIGIKTGDPQLCFDPTLANSNSIRTKRPPSFNGSGNSTPGPARASPICFSTK